MTQQDASPSFLTAEAIVPLTEPAGMLARLCEHFASHGMVARADARSAAITSPFGGAELELVRDGLLLRARCPDESALALVKSALAERVFLCAGDEKPAFAWTGHRAGDTALPYLRVMTVRNAFQLTPVMRRVVLAGDAAHFSRGGLHVRVLIPPRDRPPVDPSAGPDGRIVWPTGDDALTPRVYTVRTIDLAHGEIGIDVALHAGAPGSDWACSACAGDRIALLGPGGAGLAVANRYVLAGDETALPAIARMLAALPAHAQAVVRIEVADAAEEQPLPSAATVDLAYLHRNGGTAGRTDLLEAAVRSLPWPAHNDGLYVWAGAEQATARALRRYVSKERGLEPRQRSIAAYWRLGHAGVDVGD